MRHISEYDDEQHNARYSRMTLLAVLGFWAFVIASATLYVFN